MRHSETNAATGETRHWDEIIPGVVSEADQSARDKSEVAAAMRAAIIAEMDAADVRAMRAFVEGDAARIAEHVAAQDERRARLRAI